MPTYDDFIADVAREEIWLLHLLLDRCSKFNPAIGGLDSSGGVDLCNAITGCRYTWATCKDTASYTKETKTYKYCNRGARLTGHIPALAMDSISHMPTKIEHGRFRTELQQKTFNLEDFQLDDKGWELSNPDKGDWSQSDSGRYWPNFIARNKYFQNRIAEVRKGFKGLNENDFVLDFRGFIYDIDWARNDRIKIIVRDLLSKLGTKQFPNEIPSNVVLDGQLLSGETTDINLTDGGGGTYDPNEHFDSPTAEQPRCVKIDDEYILYTSIASGKLNGTLTRGAFGTTPATHADGSEIKQVVIYANDDAATWANCTGVLACQALLDMLIYYAGIPGEYIETKTSEYGLTLNGAIDASQTSFNLNVASSATVDLPDSGILKIDNEWIYYGALDSVADPISCKRGMFGSTKASHSNGATVEVSGPTDAFGQYRTGLLVKSRFEDQYNVDDKIQTFRQSTLIDPWTNEDGKVDFKLLIPESARTLTDRDTIFKSISVKRRSLFRYSRAIVYYDPNTADPKTSQSSNDAWRDYNNRWGYIDAADEVENAYGEAKIKPIFAEWLYQADDAKWTAGHYNSRYSDPAPHIEFSLELKDDVNKVGDLVTIADPRIVDEDGNALSDIYEIISKQRVKGTNRIKYLAERSGLAFQIYGRIGPINGVLAHGIDNSETTPITVDLSGTTLQASDWRTGGSHQIIIESEKITYTVASENSDGNVVLSNITRGVDGTTPAAHSGDSSAGANDVLMLFSASSNSMRGKYGWIGDSANNYLDGNGNFAETIEGYIIF